MKSDEGIGRRKIFLILGMHRSGTSCAAAALRCFGVEHGDNLLPPVKGINDKGFYEDVDFCNLNEEIFKLINNAWWALKPVTSEDEEKFFSSELLQRAIDLIKSKVLPGGRLCLKDPRFVKLIRLWRRIFQLAECDVSHFLCYRNPLAVCESLQKRDLIPIEAGYLMWVDSIVTSLVELRDEDYFLIPYDGLVDDPDCVLGKMSEHIKMPLDLDLTREYKSEIVDNSLRHQRYSAADISNGPSRPRIVDDLNLALMAVAMGLKLSKPPISLDLDNLNAQRMGIVSVYPFFDPLLSRIQEFRARFVAQGNA